MDIPPCQLRKAFKNNNPKIRIIKNTVCLVSRNGRIMMHSRTHRSRACAINMAKSISNYTGIEIKL